MGIRNCQVGDLPEVARLHEKVFANDGGMPRVSTDFLESHYSKLLFGHPWVDDSYPSFVFERPDGCIGGFLGVIPRPMHVNGRAVICAVSTRLMVDPDHRSPFAAIELLRAYLSGPQDLSYSDGSTTPVRRMWETLGGTLVPALSIKWARILRPALLVGSRMATSARAGRIVAALAGPGDAIARHLAPFRLEGPSLACRPMPVGDLVSALNAESSRHSLHPVYSEQDVQWLLDFMAEDPDRPAPRPTAVLNEDGDAVGWHVTFPEPGGVTEVVNLGADPQHFGQVLGHVIQQAEEDGAAAVQGKMSLAHLGDYWDRDCFGKRGAWTLFTTDDPDIRRAFLTGDAYLQGLEGETTFPLQRPPAGGRM